MWHLQRILVIVKMMILISLGNISQVKYDALLMLKFSDGSNGIFKIPYIQHIVIIQHQDIVYLLYIYIHIAAFHRMRRHPYPPHIPGPTYRTIQDHVHHLIHVLMGLINLPAFFSTLYMYQYNQIMYSWSNAPYFIPSNILP